MPARALLRPILLSLLGVPGAFAGEAVPGTGDGPWVAVLGAALALLGVGFVALIVFFRNQRRDLEESQAHYRHLVELAESYIAFRIRFDPARGLVPELASPSIARLLGHPLDHYQQDTGRFFAQILDEDRRRVEQAVGEAMASGRPLRIDFRITHPADSRPRHLAMHSVPVRTNRGMVFDGICMDLTLDAEAEERRRQLQEQIEMTQRHESLGLLAGGLAHDFNNLLGAIRGNAELLRPAVEADDHGRLRWQRLMMAVDRAAGLVRQILAYTGKGAVESRPLDLEQEIRQLSALVKAGLPPDIQVDLAIEAGLPPVLFDVIQFQQVLLNLVVNAAESYGGKPGTVRVALERKGAQWLRLRVSDQGCGMSPEVKRRMYEPYFTTKDQGHGLGLAAVRGIVTKVGGNMDCESTTGRGTTFTILLAVSERTGSTARYDSPGETPAGRQAILVVDDDDLMRDATGAMLRTLGYETAEASGGLECLAMLAQRPGHYSAVVLDCRMPDLDGISVLRRLREAKERIRVVLVSGMTMGQDLGGELRDRRTRFLPKPFTQAQLGQMLAAMFGSRATTASDADSAASAAGEYLRRKAWSQAE